MYLTQSIIADNPYMRLRVASCAAQEGCTEVGLDPDGWTRNWCKVWSTAPGWDSAWESALANPGHGDDYDPGSDPSVITDSQILSQVQAMTPFTMIEDHKPEAVAPDQP